MNWIKITKDTLPKFEQEVLLRNANYRTNSIAIGYLTSIDINGFNWRSTSKIYTGTYSNENVNTFTHYAEIDLTTLPYYE
jgi:hypothetical protein